MRGASAAGPARASWARFGHIDEVAEAIRVADAELTLKSRSSLGGWVAGADLGDCVFQAGGVLAPHLAHATIDPRRVVVYVLVDGAVVIRGRALEPTHLGLYRPGAEHQHVSNGFAFAVAAIPERDLASAVSAVTGAPWRSPREALGFVRPDRPALRHLREELSDLTSVVRRHPERLASAPARRTFERDVVDAAARALASAAPVGAMGRPSSHSAVVSSVEEYLRGRSGEAITVTDMCRAARATERTLRNAFRRVYGMGPNRFVRLRRLNEMHRLLQEPSGPHDTVTAVATRLGIWDLGRFAGQYRALFGETPSETLSRAR